MTYRKVAHGFFQRGIAPGRVRDIASLSRIRSVGAVPCHRRDETRSVIEHLTQLTISHRIVRKYVGNLKVRSVELDHGPVRIHAVKRGKQILRARLHWDLVQRTRSVNDGAEVALAWNCTFDRHASAVV